MIVCVCNNVSEEEILECNTKDVNEIQMLTGACINCMTCYTYIQDLVNSDDKVILEGELVDDNSERT